MATGPISALLFSKNFHICRLQFLFSLPSLEPISAKCLPPTISLKLLFSITSELLLQNAQFSGIILLLTLPAIKHDLALQLNTFSPFGFQRIFSGCPFICQIFSVSLDVFSSHLWTLNTEIPSPAWNISYSYLPPRWSGIQTLRTIYFAHLNNLFFSNFNIRFICTLGNLTFKIMPAQNLSFHHHLHCYHAGPDC